jgi:hypothetical protein
MTLVCVRTFRVLGCRSVNICSCVTTSQQQNLETCECE